MELHITTILDYLKEKGHEFHYLGNKYASVTGFCSLNNIKPHSITWIKHFSEYDISTINKEFEMIIVADIHGNGASLVKGYNIIDCKNPKEIFFSILAKFFKEDKPHAYISPNSVVEAEKIGKNVNIGHNCYICKDVTIGNNVIIHNNVVIECKTSIGDNTIINSGVVIGTDGFGYYKIDDGSSIKVPQLG